MEVPRSPAESPVIAGRMFPAFLCSCNTLSRWQAGPGIPAHQPSVSSVPGEPHWPRSCLTGASMTLVQWYHCCASQQNSPLEYQDFWTAEIKSTRLERKILWMNNSVLLNYYGKGHFLSTPWFQAHIFWLQGKPNCVLVTDLKYRLQPVSQNPGLPGHCLNKCHRF